MTEQREYFMFTWSRTVTALAMLGFCTGLAAAPGPAQATDKVKLQQCLALRKCRDHYSYCFNRLEKKVKPENWSAEREKCVVTYKACMAKNFKGEGMWFTRYFVPDEDCSQYR